VTFVFNIDSALISQGGALARPILYLSISRTRERTALSRPSAATLGKLLRAHEPFDFPAILVPLCWRAGAGAPSVVLTERSRELALFEHGGPVFEWRDRVIYGATAHVLHELPPLRTGRYRWTDVRVR
jgi:hypothetical protein